MTGQSRKQLPDFDDLVAELRELRGAGITKLRGLNLPALGIAAHVLADGDDPAGIETLLRHAVERIGGGELGDAAAYLFGFVPGTRGRSPTELRVLAADRYGELKAENFRKSKEPTVIAQVAEQILALCREGELRAARSQMERREPAESRLAVQWVERFEDYYRIWTPIIGLAGDLTAYRYTLNDVDRPWDLPNVPGRRPMTVRAETETYSQELQAEGYLRFAMFCFAEMLWEVRQFVIRRGGFWLLSDAEAEVAVADAIYRMSWHSPNNEQDDSWMRTVVGDSDVELHNFQQLVSTSPLGEAIHREWQQWAARCDCRWDTTRSADERGSYFATSKTDAGISEACSLHQVVEACSDYCEMIDVDWTKIADWYRIDHRPPRGVMGEDIYRDDRRTNSVQE